MKIFNKLFNTETTFVLMAGVHEYNFRKVLHIHADRKYLEVEGVDYSLQPADIIDLTNEVPIALAKPGPFFADQYDSVYYRGTDAHIYMGNLNGRTLDQFVSSIESRF